MSNNRFLKSNDKSNNRFQFLEPGENHLKQEKKIISKYESTDNSFTKSSDRRDDRRDDYRNIQPTKQPKPIKSVVIDITAEYFPDLIPIKNEPSPAIQQSKQYINFKDIVNTKIQEEIIDETKIINRGWVRISKSKINNEIIWKYGPPTEFEIKLQKQEELENNINYCMNKAIETIQEQWNKYKEEYDELNGEDSYDEKYSLPPVYGPEYENEDAVDDEYNYNSYDD
jgi:hypothetical protein